MYIVVEIAHKTPNHVFNHNLVDFCGNVRGSVTKNSSDVNNIDVIFCQAALLDFEDILV